MRPWRGGARPTPCTKPDGPQTARLALRIVAERCPGGLREAVEQTGRRQHRAESRAPSHDLRTKGRPHTQGLTRSPAPPQLLGARPTERAGGKASEEGADGGRRNGEKRSWDAVGRGGWQVPPRGAGGEH